MFPHPMAMARRGILAPIATAKSDAETPVPHSVNGPTGSGRMHRSKQTSSDDVREGIDCSGALRLLPSTLWLKGSVIESR